MPFLNDMQRGLAGFGPAFQSFPRAINRLRMEHPQVMNTFDNAAAFAGGLKDYLTPQPGTLMSVDVQGAANRGLAGMPDPIGNMVAGLQRPATPSSPMRSPAPGLSTLRTAPFAARPLSLAGPDSSSSPFSLNGDPGKSYLSMAMDPSLESPYQAAVNSGTGDGRKTTQIVYNTVKGQGTQGDSSNIFQGTTTPEVAVGQQGSFDTTNRGQGDGDIGYGQQVLNLIGDVFGGVNNVLQRTVGAAIRGGSPDFVYQSEAYKARAALENVRVQAALEQERKIQERFYPNEYKKTADMWNGEDLRAIQQIGGDTAPGRKGLPQFDNVRPHQAGVFDFLTYTYRDEAMDNMLQAAQQNAQNKMIIDRMSSLVSIPQTLAKNQKLRADADISMHTAADYPMDHALRVQLIKQQIAESGASMAASAARRAIYNEQLHGPVAELTRKKAILGNEILDQYGPTGLGVLAQMGKSGNTPLDIASKAAEYRNKNAQFGKTMQTSADNVNKLIAAGDWGRAYGAYMASKPLQDAYAFPEQGSSIGEFFTRKTSMPTLIPRSSSQQLPPFGDLSGNTSQLDIPPELKAQIDLVRKANAEDPTGMSTEKALNIVLDMVKNFRQRGGQVATDLFKNTSQGLQAGADQLNAYLPELAALIDPSIQPRRNSP